MFSKGKAIPVPIAMSTIKKGKAVPVTGCGSPKGCKTWRLPHSVDNRSTDGGEVVSLGLRPRFNTRKIPRTHFC
jgi:hypothetical protein